jgi:streptomycin 6-kinase
MPLAGTHLTDLPGSFIRHNQDDPAWLAALPDLLARLAGRWSLTLGPPYSGIGINYVAPSTRADGMLCVLKVSRHVGETRAEIAALRLWDGVGAARLLDADPDSGVLLIERLEPGTMLVEVAEADDDAATLLAARVLHQLWRPVANGSDLRPLSSWCDAFDRNRDALSRGEDGFPAALFQRADALRRDLLASTESPTSLHGDLHHFNVLRGRGAQWLAIDPKGLDGDRCFDVCQFLRNPRPVPPYVNRRRLDIFCTELGLDRRRVRNWCFVHTMLNACWDYEDGNPWQSAVAVVEETLSS